MSEPVRSRWEPWKGAFDDIPKEYLEYYLWWLLEEIPASMVGGSYDVYERKGDTDKIFPNRPPRLNIAARRIAARACSLRDAIHRGRTLIPPTTPPSTTPEAQRD